MLIQLVQFCFLKHLFFGKNLGVYIYIRITARTICKKINILPFFAISVTFTIVNVTSFGKAAFSYSGVQLPYDI